MSSTSQHYNAIADTYHQAWFYAHDSAYERWMLQRVLDYALLSKTHTVCDLGGGSGRFANLIYEAVELESPVTCVDSSPVMLSYTTTGVLPVCMTMEEYVRQSGRFDRILIKEAIHHVVGIPEFFTRLYHCLRPRGKVLLITRPQHVAYPLSTRGRAIWATTQPPIGIYTEALRASGMQSVTVHTHEFPVQISKTDWLDLIRRRTWSVLSDAYLTDEELIAVMEEIDQTHDETIQFIDRLHFIVGSRSGVET
jgi:ubiquinone/menaquinone biosynthesis C-methylase UbiE